MNLIIKKLTNEDCFNLHHAYHRGVKNSCYTSIDDVSCNHLVELNCMEIRPGWEEKKKYFVLTDLGIKIIKELDSRKCGSQNE